MNSSSESGPSFFSILLYCLPAVPLSAMGILFFVQLPKFHASEIGVGLGLISIALLVSRSWDAITDPIIGYLSDRTAEPFYRRPAWVLFGSLFCATIFYWLCSKELMEIFGVGSLGFILLTIFFFLFYTAVLIPYESWALEITEDRRARTRLIMLREGATLVGTLVAGALPLVFSSLYHKEALVFSAVGVSLGGLLILSAVLAVCFVAWPKATSENELPKSAYGSFQDALHLKVFRILLFAFCLTTIAAQIPAALILFFVEDVLLLSNPPQFILQYFIGAAIGFPLWLYAANRFDKSDLWILGVLLNTAFFSFILFVEPGQYLFFSLCVVLSGVGLGGVVAIPTAIQADVIEIDTEISGERREGSFVGIWAIVRKLSAAIGVSGVLFFLAQSGYDGTEQSLISSNQAILLRQLYCFVPSIFNLMAIFFILSLKPELEILRSKIS